MASKQTREFVLDGCVEVCSLRHRRYRKAVRDGGSITGIGSVTRVKNERNDINDEETLFWGEETNRRPAQEETARYDDEEDVDVQYNPESKFPFRLKMFVSQYFFGYIIGSRGQNLKQMEQQSGAKVNISQGKDEIVISGLSRDAVLSAKNSIDILVASRLADAPYTHFVSIPLCGRHSQLVPKLRDLYSELVEQFYPTARGFDKSLLMPPERLHLTVLMLKLYNPADKEKAMAILRDCSPIIYDIVQTRSLIVRLTGLEYMNDDPMSVDVVYLKVAPSDSEKKLRALCDEIISKFKEANLTNPNDRPLKLHATIINSKYRRAGDEGADHKPETEVWTRQPRESFDASGILKRFGQVDLGTVKLTDIHLSRCAPALPDTLYYPSEHRIALP